MPAHALSPQGKSTKTVGMALGQSQDWVSASSSMQAGVAHVEQTLLVRVTVGQPVWVPEVEAGAAVVGTWE